MSLPRCQLTFCEHCVCTHFPMMGKHTVKYSYPQLTSCRGTISGPKAVIGPYNYENAFSEDFDFYIADNNTDTCAAIDFTGTESRQLTIWQRPSGQ